MTPLLIAIIIIQQELEDFVQGSGDHGIIVFSLGSQIGSLGSDEMTQTLANVFSKFPQRVIWRHTGNEPSDLGSNTKIVKYLPQNDLLGKNLKVSRQEREGIHEDNDFVYGFCLFID